MKNRIFDDEKEAVKWLDEQRFFYAHSLKKGLINVGLGNIIRNCEAKLFPDDLDERAIRNYVKAFEIDYITVYSKWNSSSNDEIQGKFVGIEAKYFNASNINNTKYHQGIGQFIEYLKWGLDYAVLVHIFDSSIGSDKIDEFKKPAYELFLCLQNTYNLPLGYICLIVDEDKDIKTSLQSENVCWMPSYANQNPFEKDYRSIKIRECIRKVFPYSSFS